MRFDTLLNSVLEVMLSPVNIACKESSHMNKNMDESPEQKSDMSSKYLCLGHSQEHDECIDYKTNLEKLNICVVTVNQKTRFFSTCLYKISFALTL
jgi:hypothetical protein